MSYTHITSFQRNELSAMIQVKAKQKDIAKVLKKHRTTIYREKQRNRIDNKTGYDARLAKLKTKERRIEANSRFKRLDNNEWLKRYIEKKIEDKWSPEQISGRLRLKYGEDKNKQISKDSIYKYTYNERKDLVKNLRCQKGKYRRRYGTRIREKEREKLKKKRIDTRPEIVDKRLRVGSWEGDTIVGKEKTIHILTHVDRLSGLALASKLNRATARNTYLNTIEDFKSITKDKKHTITYDNGATFSDYELVEKKAKIDIYFANPYHSWERGCNENFNGLLRQFFPKKSSFANIDNNDIKKAVKLINNRPRKRLNYRTPIEVFHEKN